MESQRGAFHFVDSRPLFSLPHVSLAYYGLCQTFEKIEATTKRLEILKYLTEYYVQVIQESPMELVECVYLCLNRVGHLFFRFGKQKWLN